MSDASERHVRLPDGDLLVAETGPRDGPLVILLHGFPDSWRVWRRQIAPLAEAGFRVAAPNLRGYPGSFRPRDIAAYRVDRLAGDIPALADALGRDSINLVGHDWGGLVAWRAAQQVGSRVERLAILDAPHPAVMPAQMARHPVQLLKSAYIGFFQLPRLPEAVLSRSRFAALRRSLCTATQPGAVSPAELEAAVQGWSEPGVLTAMLNYYRALRLKPPSISPTITAPTLVLWGRDDPFLGAYLAQASLAPCLRSRLEILPGGHWIQLDEAEAVNRLLIDHLSAPAT